MKKLAAVTILGFAFVTAGAMAQSFTGIVSDAMCAKSNLSKASTSEHAACARKCIGMGSPAVLIVGDKVFKVSNPDKLNAYAGKTVTVDGKLAGDTITVASVKE